MLYDWSLYTERRAGLVIVSAKIPNVAPPCVLSHPNIIEHSGNCCWNNTCYTRHAGWECGISSGLLWNVKTGSSEIMSADVFITTVPHIPGLWVTLVPCEWVGFQPLQRHRLLIMGLHVIISSSRLRTFCEFTLQFEDTLVFRASWTRKINLSMKRVN